jgi:pSer/pThr/pTyr-binding forkhead associated (FHA) protein
VSARLIGRTGATAGQDFVLMDVATIGASPENEIRIGAPGVSRRHARVVKDKDQYFLEDAGATNGTFLNGGRITREQLQHLDVITLGRAVDLIFIRRQGDTRPPLVDGITSARLTIADGAEAGAVIEVPKGELTFGRAQSCNVVLGSGLISKVHARVQRTPNQIVLQDLQSINGTFVNGSRVDSVVVLKNGDRINFAGVRELKVAIEGAAAMQQAPPAAIADEPAFNQEWKTRFVWAPDELALIEQARAEAMQLAALRSPAVTPPAADKKVAPKPAAPAAAKSEPARPAPRKPADEGKADAAAVPPAAPKPASPSPAAPKPMERAKRRRPQSGAPRQRRNTR